MTRVTPKQLAKLIIQNEILGDWQVERSRMPMIFLPLLFSEKQALEEQAEVLGVGVEQLHVYGFLKDTGPGSVNGYPFFTTIFFVTEETLNKAFAIVEQVKKYYDAIED